MAGKKYQFRKTMTWEGKRYDIKGDSELEVLEKLAALKVSLQRGEKTVGRNSTVDRWFEEWLDVYKRPAGLTTKSLAIYTQKYYGYISPAIGSMRLKDVREVHLQKILNTQAGRSQSHVTKLRMVMQAMFKKARQTRMIQHDPAEGLMLPQYTKGVRRSITDQERVHILATAQTHRAGLWVLTILYAGLRPQETAALLWKDIDFEANEIHVYKALEAGSSVIKSPKTEAGFRSVPIHSALLPRLRAARGAPFEYVFQTRDGNPLSSDALPRLWRSFRRALDIEMGATVYRNQIIESKVAPDLTAYCLRHTFCTDLERAGVPLNVAKELMGHADIATTANIYTHKDAVTLHKNIAKLSDWDEKERGKQRGNVEKKTAEN